MKKLIVVRHGNYGDDDRLSDYGKEQMKIIATKIKPHVQGLSCDVLSLVAPRATDSSDIIIAELGVPSYESHDVLWSENRHREDLPAATELVQKHLDTEVVVLVTHLEYAERFPFYFVQSVYSGGFTGIPHSVQKGEAVIIDCDAKTAELVRS